LPSAALLKLRHPDNGKRLNFLEIKDEMARRRAAALTPGHPQESETLKKSRERKAQTAPLPKGYRPKTQHEATLMVNHPVKGKTGTAPKRPAAVQKRAAVKGKSKGMGSSHPYKAKR
jgi:hypothetical protein